MAAFRMPRETQEQKSERQAAIEATTLQAAMVPLEVAGMAVEVIELAEKAVRSGNLNAISDGATSAALARAALDGAGYNVRINAASLKDTSAAESLLDQLNRLEQRAAGIEEQIRTQMTARGGMSPG